MRASFILFLLFFFPEHAFSQLSFCPGSKGDPIFQEDFSSGSLPAGTTSYQRIYGRDPQDGEYRISDQIGQGSLPFHTYLPNTTLSNGNALIVNADDMNAGLFFQRKISGLCESTTYEFSAYLMNILSLSRTSCPNGGIPINVKFQIWDETDTQLLGEGDTGDIQTSNSPYWEQYALTFQSQIGQESVILKMFNNGIGGCGNDLAIDDIIFRSCGDLTEISSVDTGSKSLNVCESNVPVTVELVATPDNTVYNRHAFQWQESIDKENWQDIAGETGRNFSSAPISSTRYFRVKIAEDAVNLQGDLCSSASGAFAVTVVENPEAPVSSGDVEVCDGDTVPPLRVEVGPDESVRWYDRAIGGVELSSGKTFIPSAEGTYYAEAVKTGFNCDSSPRTGVTLTIFSTPQLQDEDLQLCAGSEIELDAGGGNFSYRWNTGATGQQLRIDRSGTYEVTVTNASGCSATKRFEVQNADIAAIAQIHSDEASVIIEPANQGNFEYSLDGTNFQESNTFQDVPGGVYTAYVRDLHGCNTVFEEFAHIVLPKFITPNNDGQNDRFELKGIAYFSSSEIRIFNRYGKLMAAGNGADFSWDGTFNGIDMPAEDYWYHIFINGFKPMKGHFTLTR